MDDQTKIDNLKSIGVDIDRLISEHLDNIYQKFAPIMKTAIMEPIIIPDLKGVVDENTSRYLKAKTANPIRQAILLELINKILKSTKLDSIKELIEFKRIKKSDIETSEAEKILEDMGEKLFVEGGFTKFKIKLDAKENSHITNTLRRMCKDAGLNFKRYTTTSKKNKKTSTVIVYSIIAE